MTTIRNEMPTKNNNLRDLNFINNKNLNSLISFFLNNKKDFGGTSEAVEMIEPLEKVRAIVVSFGEAVKPDSYLNCQYKNATSLNDVEK